MTEDNILQQMRDMRYPGDVDVVDAVMAQVSHQPLLVAPRRPRQILRYAIAVAAVALVCVGVNTALLFSHDFDTAAIASDMTSVYDYSDQYYEAAATDDISMDEVALWIDEQETDY